MPSPFTIGIPRVEVLGAGLPSTDEPPPVIAFTRPFFEEIQAMFPSGNLLGHLMLKKGFNSRSGIFRLI
jgi:hypothetical protein